MSRAWTELVATVAGVFGLPLLILLLFAGAGLVAALWYWFPAWVPRRVPTLRGMRWRWPRWRRPRFRLRWPKWWGWLLPRWRRPRWQLRWRELLTWLRGWRRRRPAPAEPEPPPAEPVAGDELPEVPAEDLAALADRLAAQGRYAEAVRERLRAIVRDLVDRGLVDNRPGWTVTELARAAAAARAAVDPPLRAAALLFSDIWYGNRPAYAEHDARMRTLAAEVHAAAAPVGAAR
jgi:Domain of unknown function (DUF4129)